MPQRPLQLFEALRIAELQANRLLELRGMSEDVPIIESVITGLPRIEVDYEIDMPCSGASDWDSHRRVWVITLNALEPETRQRLSLLHEYKHIIDHGGPGLVDMGERTFYGRSATEYLAEYFAGCVLMPKRLVRRAWGDGIQRVADLAELFDVSERAMEVRLHQLKLAAWPTYQRSLCNGRVPFVSDHGWRRRYYRAFSPHRPTEVELTA
jgi:hypothetical protein